MNDNDTLADDLRKDSLALMKLLADEKHKSEALAAELDAWFKDEAKFYGLPYDGERKSSVAKLGDRIRALEEDLAEANAGRDKLITRDVESAMRIRALEAALAECAQVRDNWCNEYTKARDELVVARKFFDRIPAHAGIAKSNYMTTLEDLDQLRRKAYKAEAALREIAAMPNEDNEWDAVDKYATARAIAIASPAETSCVDLTKGNV